MPAPRILALAGSTREGSFNKKLVRIVARGASEAGAETTLLDLRDYPMPLYDGDLEKREGVPEPARRLQQMFVEHDGLLLASPEYNSSISGVLKNTIDWVSRPVEGKPGLRGFRNLAVGLVSASPGRLGGLRGLVHVRSILGNIGCIVLPGQVAVGNAASVFDTEGEIGDEDLRERVEGVGKAVAEFLERYHQG